MNVIVEGGAVPALVCHLKVPPMVAAVEEEQQPRPFEHEVEKGAAFALGLLAVKVNSISFPLCTIAEILLTFHCNCLNCSYNPNFLDRGRLIHETSHFVAKCKRKKNSSLFPSPNLLSVCKCNFIRLHKNLGILGFKQNRFQPCLVLFRQSINIIINFSSTRLLHCYDFSYVTLRI